MKLRPLLQIQWPAPTPAARRSTGPTVRRAAHAPPRSSPPMRRAAPTANFPAAGGRRPAGETRCVALIERFSFRFSVSLGGTLDQRIHLSSQLATRNSQTKFAQRGVCFVLIELFSAAPFTRAQIHLWKRTRNSQFRLFSPEKNSKS